MTKNKFSGLTIKYLEAENTKQYLKEIYDKYTFKFILKNGKKSNLKEIKEFDLNGQYFVFEECFKSPLITLTSDINLNGCYINAFYLDKVEAIEVYFK